MMSNSDQSSSTSGGDWRELRRRERQARREARRGHGEWAGPPLFALLLIVIGLGLLAQNFGLILPQRWWALLLLLPAVGSLVAAIRAYRGKESVPETWAAIISGVIFTVLALALFFGLDWGIFWPIVLVLLGAGILARAYWRP
jgi:hypothetical protein